MKNLTKLFSGLLLAIIIMISATNVNAASSARVSVRIEGYDKTLLEKTTVDVTANDISDIVGGAKEDWLTEQPVVTHAIVKVLQDKGYDPKDPDILGIQYQGNYIDNFFGLKTFSTSNMDGWMYTHNNEIAPVGIKETKLKDGDSIVFYFTTNYTANKYSFFDREDISAKVNEDIKLKNLTAGWDMNSGSNSSGAPIEGAYLILEQTKDGKVVSTQRKDIVTGEDGELTFKIDEPGTYRALTWLGSEKFSGLSRAYANINVTKKEVNKPTPKPIVTSKVEKRGNTTYYYSLKGKIWFNNKTVIRKGSTTTTYKYKFAKNKVKGNNARPQNGSLITTRQAVTVSRKKISKKDTIYYNNKGLAAKRRVLTLNKKNKMITTHANNRTFYANKKVKQIYNINRNLSNGSLKNRQKINYNSKGVKRKAIKLNYSRNKITKRTEHRYNKVGKLRSNKKYGNSYRYVTSYKKGKAKKTVRVKYNKKGKMIQKRKVKTIKSF